MLRLNLHRYGSSISSVHTRVGGRINTELGTVLCERKKKIGGSQYPSLSQCCHASSTRDNSSSSLDDLATEYEKTIVRVVEKVRRTFFLSRLGVVVLLYYC